MKLSLRTKLLALVATAGAALLAMGLASNVFARRVAGHLDDIQRHYLPKVSLRPQLEAQLERMQRGFQDAVSAGDREKLASMAELKQQFQRRLAEAEGAVDPAQAAALSQAIEEYTASATAVSARLIGGETGESLVAGMSEMQARRQRVAALLDKVTAFDQGKLQNAFTAAADAQRADGQMRLAVSAACLVGVFLLFLWISRDVLRSLALLTLGFRRFGSGEFGKPIPAQGSRELDELARQANQMAQSLQRLEADRKSGDWLTAGRSGLSEQLRGEMTPIEAGDRAVAYLCGYLDCPVGALHAADPDGVFRLLGRHGLTAVEASFRAGEGLAGQAVLKTDITVVQAPAGELRLRSSLVEGTPQSLALLPLLRDGHVIGLLELAALHSWEPRATELLLSVRESLAIALETAKNRAELRALLAETQDSRRRLEQQAGELTQASAYKSQFLANMSHELRTPLNAIIGFAQLLHDEEVGPLEPQQKDFLSDVLRSGKHLLQLINDVLDLSKVEAGKLEFRPEKADAEKIVGEVLGILRSSAASRRVQMQPQIDPLGELLLDPARLKQVLYNYVSNALKFSPEGGTVHIRLTAEGAEAFRIEVEDGGKGIKPEDVARLFVEFQQVQDGARLHSGTGLGLALTKRLVEAQGGTVGVRSAVGVGSTFFAVLPRRAASQPPATAAPVAELKTANAGPSVLVVEDNPADQATLLNILQRAGYSVQLAPTGKAAIELSRNRAFDAVTLDLFLPDISGLELLEKLRAEGMNRDVPVIVVTVVAERGAVAGFAVQDILPKPIDAAALVGALTRAGLPPTRSGTILVVDDDPGSLKLVATTLQQLGYQAHCERDGAAALKSLRESLPAAVILDLVMPGMNGFEFLEHLRREPAGRRLPVIVYTMKDLTPAEHTFLRTSAQAIVNKGLGGSGVLAELEAVVRHRAVASPGERHAG